MFSRADSSRSPNGRSRGIFSFLQKSRSSKYSSLSVPNGFTAPFLMVRLRSGMTRSISTPMVLPKPRHLGHAPMGLLKENRFGLGGGIGEASVQSAHERSELNLLMRSGITTTASRPLPIV